MFCRYAFRCSFSQVLQRTGARTELAEAKDLFPALSLIVMDEADALLSPAHRRDVNDVLTCLDSNRFLTAGGGGSAASSLQYVVCAATLLTSANSRASSGADAGSFGAWLHRHMQHAVLVRSPGLHRPTPGVRVNDVVVDVGIVARSMPAPARGAGPTDPVLEADGDDAAFVAALRDAKLAALLKALRLELSPSRAMIASVAVSTSEPVVGSSPRLDDAAGGQRHALPFLEEPARGIAGHTFVPDTGETIVRLAAVPGDDLLDSADADDEQTAASADVGVGMDAVDAGVSDTQPSPKVADTAAAPQSASSPQLRPGPGRQALVFVANAASAEDVLEYLETHATDLRCATLHKTLSPVARADAINAWFDGELDVLVATDIASRGLDSMHVSVAADNVQPQRCRLTLHVVA